jgi:hypothetical protein
MDTRNIPANELQALADRLLQNLRAGAGEHNRVLFNVDLANNPDQDEMDCLSYRGGIKSIDAGAKDKPFVKGRFDNELRALLSAAHAQGCAIYFLQFLFTKTGLDWAYEIKAQSCDEYRQMCLDRKPLEDKLEPMLVAAANAEVPDWKQVELCIDSIKKKLRVIVRDKASKIKDLEVTESIRQGFDAIDAFYVKYGFKLDSFGLEIMGGRKKLIREVNDYYV